MLYGSFFSPHAIGKIHRSGHLDALFIGKHYDQ
jgi:hypothetical protein